ncbi:Phospholipase DDHD1 [Babesia bigemina]|uniref:Phospholipase DDHD1 n=1 Tax=Babesia bigemina TaxID=5866 RepID=A0A061D217_BABBI|nr:Phospholipase DDHD1 [Babesia bigemina]CDR94673.1 Phospholipase DDHD1 [Babesia bigemina]|eukprot:XP_012766859.1 Phospholipase DDHD1 [Babesia bigemina]
MSGRDSSKLSGNPDGKGNVVEEQERQYERLRDKLHLSNHDSASEVDFIIFMLHGIGSNSNVLGADYRMIKYSLSSIKRHWFYHDKLRTHVHLLDWKKHIIDAQSMLFDHTYITTAKETRKMITSHILDIGFYLNPRYCDFLLENIVAELDGEISRLRHHPSGKFRNSKIAIVGYSLGSLILHEILCGNPGRASNLRPEDRPKLRSKVDYMFCVGSPLSCFMIFQSPQYMATGMCLPEGVEAYNIFHPYDPVAYRWERLIYRDVKELPEPEILPYWQNNGFKNWYGWERSVQQAKTMIVDNISDVASTIGRSIFGWWGSSKSNSVLANNVANPDKRSAALSSFKLKLKERTTPDNTDLTTGIINPTTSAVDAAAEPRAEERTEHPSEQDQWSDDAEGGDAVNGLFDEERLAAQSAKALHDMNKQAGGHLRRRYDFQLQEDITEHLLSPLGIIQSHTNYWSSKDLMFFILKKLKKGHARVSITTYFKSIRLRAKWLADCAANDELKAKFLALSEEASACADRVAAEDNKARLEAAATFSSTWSNFMKWSEEYCEDAEHVCSDPID